MAGASVQHTNLNDTKLYNPNYETLNEDGKSKPLVNEREEIPPPPYSSAQPSSAQLLHVYRDSALGHDGTITASDKSSPLYTFKISSCLFSSKPQMKIHTPSNTSTLATAYFHKLGSTTDVTIHDRAITLHKQGLFSKTHKYSSPAFGGATVTWKSDGGYMGGDLVCVGPEGKILGKFDRSGMAMKKDGKIEITEGIEDDMREEIVVMGLVMVELRRRARQCAASSGGGAGSFGG